MGKPHHMGLGVGKVRCHRCRRRTCRRPPTTHHTNSALIVDSCPCSLERINSVPNSCRATSSLLENHAYCRVSSFCPQSPSMRADLLASDNKSALMLAYWGQKEETRQ